MVEEKNKGLLKNIFSGFAGSFLTAIIMLVVFFLSGWPSSQDSSEIGLDQNNIIDEQQLEDAFARGHAQGLLDGVRTMENDSNTSELENTLPALKLCQLLSI